MKTKEKLLLCSLLFTVGMAGNLFFSTAIHHVLSRQSVVLRFYPPAECLGSLFASRQHLMMFFCLQGFILILCLLFFLSNLRPYQSDLVKITPDIETPVPVGQHQHGSARWLTDDEKDKAFDSFVLDPDHPAIRRFISEGQKDLQEKKASEAPDDLTMAAEPDAAGRDAGAAPKSPAFSIPKGGVVLGMKRDAGKEKIYFAGDDIHTLTIGATRSGKTRSVVLQTVCALALAGDGESMVICDPKAEIYQYCSPFLERLGYSIPVLDLRTPEKSWHYNFLQPIVDAVKSGNLERAEMLAWDMTTILVGKETGNSERIWHNGEMSVIAATILCVVCDNVKRYDYQNLTNVYWFMAEMCKTIGGKMPIIEYIKKLPQAHPARALLSISDVAPTRTRGSFYTSALTTLRLFTARSINAITCKSDFSLSDVGIKKQALFIILPDEKTTFYPIASLVISQQYELLVQMADQRGGRLERRVNFILEEFGNFSPISDMTTKLTVVRDVVQSSIISVATTNYDEVYNGLREGYSGGYTLSGTSWDETLDTGDIYGQLDSTLGLARQGGHHLKFTGDMQEYALWGLDIDILNAPFAPSNANSAGKFLADPASKSRSEQEWDISIILNEARQGAGAGGPFWIIGP